MTFQILKAVSAKSHRGKTIPQSKIRRFLTAPFTQGSLGRCRASAEAMTLTKGYCTKSLFNIFKKQNQQSGQLTTLKVGDWVTQYSAGYWMVVNIFPKYADEDYSYNGKSWKKGDRLGDWVVLKKGFTPKMKPSNDCDFIDAQWCKPVSNDIIQSIESTFAESQKAKAKFENAPNMPKPSVVNAWLKLSDEQAESFLKSMQALPERFTLEEFWSYSASYRQYIVDPSEATHILYLFSYLWEIDDNFEPFHFDPELKKL